MKVITKHIRVYGIVQGVGFRPTVSRHGMRSGITGTVCNRGPYVEIFAQGSREQVDMFLDLLKREPPKRAMIIKIDAHEIESPVRYDSFEIIESEKTSGEIFVSPDIAICDTCIEEMYDPKNRRYLHPFINCTCCGPRLTILDALPYDRERTSMKEFPMCPDCAEEYYSPESRRYDAQPVCCNECGPQVYLIGRPERGRDAITFVRRTIIDGGIVAIKGIGGFHLCCDAQNQKAVQTLRDRKIRPAKPFSVMMRSMDVIERECMVRPEQMEMLTGHQKPILLLERRDTGTVCDAVAPDNPKIGVMLPYAPIQLLLFDYDDGLTMPDCLVMTSGNISGAPICRDDEDAVKELSHLCECMISHDRLIRIRADDSVMDYWRNRPYMIRRSRGFAPLPFLLSKEYRGGVLATGGELKNTFCIGVNSLFYPSPYVGDLEDLRTVRALRETIGRLEVLLEMQPEAVACDLHPKYNSTEVAKEFGLPVIPVQHHYAHVVSCMAENDYADRVIGVSFDGTGYGTDDTVWGGEILLSDYRGFERIGSIRPFLQTGGDLSAKEGWRIAVSLLYGLSGRDRERTLDQVSRLGLCSPMEAKAVMGLQDRNMNTIRSTSAGRLFDAVSALLGVRRSSTFEGEASTTLQFVAERADLTQRKQAEKLLDDAAFSDPIDGRMVLATDRLVRRVLEEQLLSPDRCGTEGLAWLFHLGLSRQITAACLKAREETGVETAALTGGCYQNLLLLDMTVRQLEENGFRVLTHSLTPPNDGGIALGQAVVAMEQLNRNR